MNIIVNNYSHSPRPDGSEDILKIICARRSVMKYLGVPEGCKLMACLIFGYPVKLIERTPKRVENVILNWIK